MELFLLPAVRCIFYINSFIVSDNEYIQYYEHDAMF